jgi:hypothetical protein
MSNENTQNTENNMEEIEIINVGRDGISYNELKSLHNMSMVTLNNMSRVLPSPSSSSSSSSSTTTRLTLYSSRDVKISKANNNWLLPYYPFKEGCRVCRYFGHALRNCPNIQSQYRGADYCISCWQTGHISGSCSGDPTSPPYNENFISPEEIINNLFYR